MTDPETKKTQSSTIKAYDIMSEVIVTITEDTLVKDAAHLMLRDQVNGLPVVDKNKTVIGMLTLTDLFTLVDQAAQKGNYGFYKKLFHERELKTSEVMSRSVCIISPATSLEKIIRIILTKKIHTFPVIEHGKLIGMIGRHDILNAVFTF